MITSYEPAAYGVGNLKPHEFRSMTPAEFTPYITARAKREEEIVKMENDRIGLICSILQNGIPTGSPAKGARKHKPGDYFGSSEPAIQKPQTEVIFSTMMAWTSATGGGVHG